MANFGLDLNEYNELMDRLGEVTELRVTGKEKQAWALFDLILAEEQVRTARKWQAIIEFNETHKDVVF